ncbi:hypothetical protein J6590_074272 [Homalodisca vitripennis]|nr:hypothetical protein J6590_074272 [Homalodisca vitripennis]
MFADATFLVLMVLSSSGVSDAAAETAPLICRLINQDLASELREELHSSLLQLLNENAQFSAEGCFQINRKTLASMAAAQDNQIKQRRAWLLLGQVTAERSCPCKRPACPAIGGGSEVTFKPLVPRLSVREGFLALTSPDRETNGLKVTSEPPPMAGQVGCLKGQDRSAATHLSSSHARRCLFWLSCDNRCTRYTAPLANR